MINQVSRYATNAEIRIRKMDIPYNGFIIFFDGIDTDVWSKKIV
ncbi:MAG: hypothetical protein ACHQF0_05540 [Chitinophagales bacterium]